MQISLCFIQAVATGKYDIRFGKQLNFKKLYIGWRKMER